MLGAIVTLATAPRAQALEISVELGLQTHRLREFDADGMTLVREHGLAPRASLRLAHPLNQELALRGRVGGWAARADYEGQTQGGLPIDSHTDTASLMLEASLAWQSISTPFGLEAGIQYERLRRQIRGAAGNSGLDETLEQPRWLVRASWRTAGTTLAAGILWGPPAPVSVRFENQLYDTTRTRTGRSTGLTFEVSRPLGHAWRIGANMEVLQVESGSLSSLRRGGQAVGMLGQPRLQRDQLTVTLERSLQL